MKTEKMTLKGIKNMLSREEMKKIMAGSGSGGGTGGNGGGGCNDYQASCQIDLQCCPGNFCLNVGGLGGTCA